MDTLIKYGKLPPEDDNSGNTEYKRLVKNGCIERLERLTTQMEWRISQGVLMVGIPEAIYYVGIDDCGEISGESIDSIMSSITNLEHIASKIDSVVESNQITVFESGVVSRVVIRKNSKFTIKEEVKICFLGGSNQGKSTLISVITHGDLDDGDGLARSIMLRYDHEFQQGTTSSIKSEIVGFKNNKPINYKEDFCISWNHIVKKSDKVVQLIDLPGCSKYIKTTIFGLMGYKPDHVFVVNSATSLNDQETLDHIKLCEKLNIPFTKIVTKTDLVDPNVLPKDGTINISSVSGDNIDKLYDAINGIESNKCVSNMKDVTEFMINDVLYISDVGLVVSGIVKKGILKLYDKLIVGPYKNSFFDVNVVSIHKKQVPCRKLNILDSGSVVLTYDETKLKIDKHMVLVTKNLLTKFVNRFQVKIDRSEEFSVQNIILMAFINNIYSPVKLDMLKEDDTHCLYSAKFKGGCINMLEDGDKICIRYSDRIIVGTCMII